MSYYKLKFWYDKRLQKNRNRLEDICNLYNQQRILVFRIYREFLMTNKKKTNIQYKNDHSVGTGKSQCGKSECLTNIWKDAQIKGEKN